MITADSLKKRLENLMPIGLSDRGTNRLAWTAEDMRAADWFQIQAENLGLNFERDPAGNLWATPSGDGPWWAVGSHLDSVRDGGMYDGALGVAAGFEVAASTDLDIVVISFADEEGARFNTPTFGSKAMAGMLDYSEIVTRTDDDGIHLGEAMRPVPLDPTRISEATTWIDRLLGFVELHIDQSRALDMAGSSAGTVAGLASRMRVLVEVNGRADHSGTTRRGERADALAAAARLIVLADDLTPDDPSAVVTASRIMVEPNAATTIPSRVRAWIDARGPAPELLTEWLSGVRRGAETIAERGRVQISVQLSSRSDGIDFDSNVREALNLSGAGLGCATPELLCYAGHDAGVIATRRPAGMVFVRNPTGISHSSEESIKLEDAAIASNVLLGAIERLAG